MVTTARTPEQGDGFVSEQPDGGWLVEGGGRRASFGAGELPRAIALCQEWSDRPRWLVKLNGAADELP